METVDGWTEEYSDWGGLEHLIEYGPGDIATVFGRAFELAMQIERERFLRAAHR
jgi:hypothetical protein